MISKENAYMDEVEDDPYASGPFPSAQENKNFKEIGGEGGEANSAVPRLPGRNGRNYEVSSVDKIDEANLALEDDSQEYEVDEQIRNLDVGIPKTSLAD